MLRKIEENWVKKQNFIKFKDPNWKTHSFQKNILNNLIFKLQMKSHKDKKV